MAVDRRPISSDRVRHIGGQGFVFVPHRFLRDGFFASLAQDEQVLYFFLVLAGDRDGVSFYSYDKICRLTLLSPDAYIAARNGLIAKDLVAFDGTRFQVLSLPDEPLREPPSALDAHDPRLREEDPAWIRAELRRSLDIEPDGTR